MKISTSVAIAAPSIGPAAITIFGTEVPVLAMLLSITGLILARWIAPPPLRKLSRAQEWGLTALLILILILIVTGEIGDGTPIKAGPAALWGIGLGFSGLLVIEFFGDRAIAMLRAAFGKE